MYYIPHYTGKLDENAKISTNTVSKYYSHPCICSTPYPYGICNDFPCSIGICFSRSVGLGSATISFPRFIAGAGRKRTSNHTTSTP